MTAMGPGATKKEVDEAPLGNFMRHCVGTCEICKIYGGDAARAVMTAVEAAEGGREGADDYRDGVANATGISCCQAKLDCYQCCFTSYIRLSTFVYLGVLNQTIVSFDYDAWEKEQERVRARIEECRRSGLNPNLGGK